MFVGLPLALTLARLAAGPVFVLLAWCRASGTALAALLVFGLLSDIFDGIISRDLGVATLAMRRLDTRADLVFYSFASATALWMNPSLSRRGLPWLAGYAVIFVLRNLVDFIRYRASPSYHMYSGKLWSMIIFVELFAAFFRIEAFFLLPLGFAVYLVNAVEGIIASVALPQPCKDIPTLWHALRRDRR